jgi:hypothetical protein
VRFELVQRYASPVADVEAAFIDPALLARLGALNEMGRPQLLDQATEGDVVRQRVRYAFSGHLAPAATAVVDRDRLTWVQDSVLDRRTHRTEFRILPDHYADRLTSSGVVTLQETDGGTARVTSAELSVRFPLVGGRVERAIVSGLREHSDAEAHHVQAWLDERRP